LPPLGARERRGAGYPIDRFREAILVFVAGRNVHFPEQRKKSSRMRHDDMNDEPVAVLHVLGGLDLRGGAETVVQQWMATDFPNVEQRLWMHRDFETEDPRVVCGGRSRLANHSILNDAREGCREGMALCGWLRASGEEYVLHAHSRVGQIAAAIAGFWLGTPVVIHAHVLPQQTWIYHLLARISNATFVYNSAKTCRHFGAEVSQNWVVTPGIEWSEGSARSRSGLRFVAASSFVAGKHLLELVEAFGRLRNEGHEAELVLWGRTGRKVDNYESEVIQQAEMVDGILVRDWSPNWDEDLCADDIFVHLGEPESFGIVMLQAFLVGCRMVVPQNSFLDELPAPLDCAGVERVTAIKPDLIAAAMARAAGLESAPDLRQPRLEVKDLFGPEAQRLEISVRYRELAALGRS
jgi:glycosyltransferase involved in cell wall biosynthesis